jgi:hypothetical protein
MTKQNIQISKIDQALSTLWWVEFAKLSNYGTESQGLVYNYGLADRTQCAFGTSFQAFMRF